VTRPLATWSLEWLGIFHWLIIIHLVVDYQPSMCYIAAVIPRHITPFLLDALKDSPVVLLTGARQSGKSTLVKWVVQKERPARYLTLDNAGVLAAARHDPSGFLAGLDGPVALDEVQRVPELFLAIKAAVDENRTPGRFLLTGSANVLLVPRISESMAGRMEILTLWPFSQSELASNPCSFIDAVFAPKLPQFKLTAEPQSDLLQRIVLGGFPEVQTRSTSGRRDSWFSSYITTILQRDIRELANIEGLTALPRLLALLAARAGALLNYAELSNSAAIAQTTLKRYMTLLETTFLIQLLPAWSGNLSKRLIKTPKLFLTDTGLMAHLMGADRERLAADVALCGRLLENFILMELVKQATWSRTEPRLYHLRTQTGQEVDLVLERADGALVGIEVKRGASPGPGDFKALRVMAEVLQGRFVRGIVLYQGNEIVPFDRNLVALPVTALWQTRETRAQ